MRSARGFSLVECMVAAVVLAAGLLAITASSRAMLQLDMLGGRIAGAAEVAASRLATLRAAPCSAGAGSATAGPFDEQWSVVPAGWARDVSLDVSFTHDGRRRAVRYQGALLCAPP